MDPRARRTPSPGSGVRRRTAPARLFVAVALAGLASCVSPPSAEELARVGYRSPEQTFTSFQIAVRADSPVLEYRCLSAGFRERNRVSQLTWREFRDEWYASHPLLRRALAKARILSVEELATDRRVLLAESHGHRLRVHFVREAFYQVYAGDMLHADELLPQQRGLAPYLGAEPLEQGRALLSAAVELRATDLPEHPTEFRIGLEWKIDGIEEPRSD